MFDPIVELAKADADGDGQLSLSEFLAARLGTEADFRAADASGDGQITLQELKRWSEARAQPTAAPQPQQLPTGSADGPPTGSADGTATQPPPPPPPTDSIPSEAKEISPFEKRKTSGLWGRTRRKFKASHHFRRKSAIQELVATKKADTVMQRARFWITLYTKRRRHQSHVCPPLDRSGLPFCPPPALIQHA